MVGTTGLLPVTAYIKCRYSTATELRSYKCAERQESNLRPLALVASALSLSYVLHKTVKQDFNLNPFKRLANDYRTPHS